MKEDLIMMFLKVNWWKWYTEAHLSCTTVLCWRFEDSFPNETLSTAPGQWATHSGPGLWTQGARRRHTAGRRCGSSSHPQPAEITQASALWETSYSAEPLMNWQTRVRGTIKAKSFPETLHSPETPLWTSLTNMCACWRRWYDTSCQNRSGCISRIDCCCRYVSSLHFR